MILIYHHFHHITIVLIGLPSDWDMENIASFLKVCGDSLCREVLGNKAINGRVPELACILYYLWQVGGYTYERVQCSKDH